MSVLDVAQQTAVYIGMNVPAALMASTEREHVELREIIQECAERIAFDAGHEWRLLHRLHTITGDGTSPGYALPSDYRRMTTDTQLWTSRLDYPLEHIDSPNRWLEIDELNYAFVVGVWADLGGELRFKPTLQSGETVRFYYLSDLIVSPASGDDTARFGADDDGFRLSERLLKLCAIWQWKEAKGLEYAEDMANYEMALARAIADDKGARDIRVGRGRRPRGVRYAYPRTLPST